MPRNEDENPNPGRIIETRFVMAALGDASAVRVLTAEEAQIAARKLLGGNDQAERLEAAMRERGLLPSTARARAYTPFSKVLGRSKLVVVVPYNSSDSKSSLVGGVGVSEGEPPSGIIVELKNLQIANIITLDVIGGELVINEISAKELIAQGPKPYVDTKYDRGNLERHLTADQSAVIAHEAFKVLLFDDHSSLVHSTSDLRELVHNAPLVSAIAELQYMRLEGITFSPDVSCCSCCCCCWGSCSSCSATATKYVNQFYEQHPLP